VFVDLETLDVITAVEIAGSIRADPRIRCHGPDPGKDVVVSTVCSLCLGVKDGTFIAGT